MQQPASATAANNKTMHFDIIMASVLGCRNLGRGQVPTQAQRFAMVLLNRAGRSGADNALRIRSGANPNNCNRHWQAGGEGAEDHQGECEKRVRLRAHVVY